MIEVQILITVGIASKPTRSKPAQSSRRGLWISLKCWRYSYSFTNAMLHLLHMTESWSLSDPQEIVNY